jgi:hypothetical protein
MNGQPETPVQEAVSLVSIAAILLGVGCYVGAINNTPILSPALFVVAEVVYNWFPQLSGLHSPQMPMLIAASTVGGLTWILGVPFAPLLARAFNSQQMASLERQTIKLKRNRARIIKNRRDRDDYDVS